MLETTARRLARAVLVLITTLFFLFRGFAANAPVGGSRVDAAELPTALAFAAALTCLGQEDQGHAPRPEHGDLKCCVLCKARDSAGADSITRPGDGSPRLAPVMSVGATTYVTVASPIPRLGWTGAWSSGAPPPRA
jgi:hypothetical protein